MIPESFVLTIFPRENNAKNFSEDSLPDVPYSGFEESEGVQHVLSFDTQTFQADCQAVVGELRAALLALYRSVDADPMQPQAVSRRFGVNKNLTWKIAKVLETEDCFEAAALLPGSSGLRILIDAVAQKGEAAVGLAAAARRAWDGFEEMVERHAGDRAGLELMLDSMGVGEKPQQKSRQRAFQGASGLWGVQCDAQVIARFMAPSSSDQGLLDHALVTGWTGVRRLREIAPWPLINLQLRNDDGTPSAYLARREPLVESDAPHAWMLDEFASGARPDIQILPSASGLAFELGAGEVGRQGEFTCYFGYRFPSAVPRFADEHNTHGEFRHEISIPTRNLLLDLFVHRELEEALATRVRLFGNLRARDPELNPAFEAPISERLLDMGTNPRVATPLVERYSELIGFTVERTGWDLRDFRLLRLRCEHPPMHAMASIRYPLPKAGEER